MAITNRHRRPADPSARMSEREIAFVALDAAQRLALTGKTSEAMTILAHTEYFFDTEPGGRVTLYLATANVFLAAGDCQNATEYFERARQLQWAQEAEMGASPV